MFEDNGRRRSHSGPVHTGFDGQLWFDVLEIRLYRGFSGKNSYGYTLCRVLQ
jgi:hypothetical protein